MTYLGKGPGKGEEAVAARRRVMPKKVKIGVVAQEGWRDVWWIAGTLLEKRKEKRRYIRMEMGRGRRQTKRKGERRRVMGRG